MFNKVLVPLDGSNLAEVALAHVEEIARGCQVGEIHIISVTEAMRGRVTRAEALERLRPFTLESVAERVTCPLLVIMGRQDRVIPPADAERLAREASGPVDLWLFDEGNHVCNNIPYKYRPQQADWMRQRL